MTKCNKAITTILVKLTQAFNTFVRLLKYIYNISHQFLSISYWLTVNIGLKHTIRMIASILLKRCLCYKPEPIRPFLFKHTIRMIASILLIRCLCYKPERIRSFLFFSPNKSQVKIIMLTLPLFSLSPIFQQQPVKTHYI